MGPGHGGGVHAEEPAFIDPGGRVPHAALAAVVDVEPEVPGGHRLVKGVGHLVFGVVGVLGHDHPVVVVGQVAHVRQLLGGGVGIFQDLQGEVAGDVQIVLHAGVHQLPGVDGLLRAQVEGRPLVVAGVVAGAPLGAVFAFVEHVVRLAAVTGVAGAAQHMGAVGHVGGDGGIDVDPVQHGDFHGGGLGGVIGGGGPDGDGGGQLVVVQGQHAVVRHPGARAGVALHGPDHILQVFAHGGDDGGERTALALVDLHILIRIDLHQGHFSGAGVQSGHVKVRDGVHGGLHEGHHLPIGGLGLPGAVVDVGALAFHGGDGVAGVAVDAQPLVGGHGQIVAVGLDQRIVGGHHSHGSADGGGHVIELVESGLGLFHQQPLHRIVAVFQGLQQLDGLHDGIHLLVELGGGGVAAAAVLGVEPGQVLGLIFVVQAAVGQLQGLGQRRIVGEDPVEAVLPVGLGVEGARVPGVVGDAEEGHLGSLGIVHGVGEHAFQAGGVGIQAVEVVQGVGVEYVVQVVVHRVVPPQHRLPADPVFEGGGGGVADVGEHVAAGEANFNILMEGLEFGHIGGSAGAAGGVPGGGEEQALDLVLSGGAFRIVGFVELSLDLVEQVDLHIAAGGGFAHGDVVHEDAELPDAQVIHMLELGHQTLHALVHGGFVGKVDGLFHGRVGHPYEVHVAGGRLLGDLAHLIGGADALLGLLLRGGLGIIHIPQSQVVGVGLGAVEEGVHLVALGKVEPAQGPFHAPGVAVVAFHAATVLLERVVLDGGHLHHAVGGLLQHQVQGGQGEVGGVGVLAQDHDVPVLEDLHHMGVVPILGGGEHVPGDVGVSVGGVRRAVDAYIQVGHAFHPGVGPGVSQAVVGEHFLDTAGGQRVDAVALHHVHRAGKGDGGLGVGDLLGDGVDQIVAGLLLAALDGGVVHRQLEDGNGLPVRGAVIGHIHPQVAAGGRGGQGHALVRGGGLRVALIHRHPVAGIVGHLELVGNDVILLPGDVHDVEGGGAAKVHIDPLGIRAGAAGVGGPPGGEIAVHCLVRCEGGGILVLTSGGGLVQGQVGGDGVGRPAQAGQSGADQAEDQAQGQSHAYGALARKFHIFLPSGQKSFKYAA